MKMTTAIAAAAAIIAAVSCNETPTMKYANLDAGANKVMERLQTAVDNGQFMYTMQDALQYGKDWVITAEEVESDPIERSDIKSVCGDFPAIAGFEIGAIEKGGDASLDNVPFVLIRKAALKHVERGGIVTFSWHCNNPLTGGDAWDVSEKGAVASVLEGGANHEMFMGWMKTVADFFDTLCDADGNRIPIIFRPWHENSGNWFWWCSQICTPQEYQQLWKMTHDYFVNERGQKNLIWAISPNSELTEDVFEEFYPGDDYIDIIGLDCYAGWLDIPAFYKASKDKYIDTMHRNLAVIERLGQKHNKMIALTETGLEGQKDPVWWTESMLEGIGDAPICYALTWRNAVDKPGHYFSPYPGAPTEEDFVKFYNSPKTLFLNDIK